MTLLVTKPRVRQRVARDSTRRLSPDQFLLLEDGVAFELWDDGSLRERNMGMESDEISGAFLQYLREHVVPRGLGIVFGGGTGLQIHPDRPKRIPRADAGFISASRLPGGRPVKGHLRAAPELVIEVVSPGDTVDEVETKVAEYLAAGVLIVWVAKPTSRTVDVWRSDGSFSRLTTADALSGEDVLPGFELPVSAVFGA